MSEADSKLSSLGISSTTKADVLRMYLFDGHSAAELSKRCGVSKAQIEDWKERAREHLEAVFEPDSARIEALCQELASLKKELGEL